MFTNLFNLKAEKGVISGKPPKYPSDYSYLKHADSFNVIFFHSVMHI